MFCKPNNYIRPFLIFLFSFVFNFTFINAKEEKASDFSVSELMFHHIKDTHDWHIADIPSGTNPDGTTRYIPIAIHLPWILYSSEKGLDIFFVEGHTEEEQAKSAEQKGYKYHHGEIHETSSGVHVLDLSITKTSLQMLIVALLLIFLFKRAANQYNENPLPKGFASFMEPIMVFVRDEVVKPNLGKHADNFLPYMLSLFFFIWFCNLFGLTPLNSNIAGNISVTAGLAILSFLIINFNGKRDYWEHIFWYPGVPLPVKFIMLPVELVGVFTKPFALTVRLFANISAGHFMVLGLISLIFVFSKGTSISAGLGIAPLSIFFSLFILSLEFLVAIVQAYVFTLLTCVFLGSALEEHHHEEAHH